MVAKPENGARWCSQVLTNGTRSRITGQGVSSPGRAWSSAAGSMV